MKRTTAQTEIEPDVKERVRSYDDLKDFQLVGSEIV
jgi:hypothetical protein